MFRFVKSLLMNSMEKWKVMLCSVNSEYNLNDEHRKIVERLDEIMLEGKTIDGIMFKKVDKKTLKVQTGRVNDAIKYFKSKNITETNDLIKAASVWVAEQIGLKKTDYRKKINLDGNAELKEI